MQSRSLILLASAAAVLVAIAVGVLASGDPFMHGVGAVLARHIDAEEMLVVPAPSALSMRTWPPLSLTKP